MAVTMKAFGEYQQARFRREEAQQWLAHNGKQGRGTDVLRLSPVHCSIKMTFAGQYSEGGKNYWETPESLQPGLIKAIIKYWPQISEAALDYMTAAEDRALIAAKAEIAAAAQAIEDAEGRQPKADQGETE